MILKGAVILHHIDVEMSNIFATPATPPPGTLPPGLNPLGVDTYVQAKVKYRNEPKTGNAKEWGPK